MNGEKRDGEGDGVDGLELDKKKVIPRFLSLFRIFLVSESRAHLWGGGKWRDAIRHREDQTSGNLEWRGPAQAEVPVLWRYIEPAQTDSAAESFVLYFILFAEINFLYKDCRLFGQG
jgi:hypothetical protein